MTPIPTTGELEDIVAELRIATPLKSLLKKQSFDEEDFDDGNYCESPKKAVHFSTAVLTEPPPDDARIILCSERIDV